MVRVSVAAVLISMMGIVGCGGGSSSSATSGTPAKASSLVGTWESSIPEMKDVTLVMNFTADGKFTQETVLAGVAAQPNVTVDGGKQEGTYTSDDKVITMSVGGKEKKMTIKELADAKMVLANDQGMELTFTKKK